METMGESAHHMARGIRMRMNRAVVGGVLQLAMMVGIGAQVHAHGLAPRQLLETADFGPPAISPDGSRVAFRIERASIERNTYDTVWYVQQLEGGAEPRRVADGGVPMRDAAGVSLPSAAVWSPDGRWIFYIASLEGKVAVWRAAVDGTGAEPVTRDAADVRGFSLSADGRQLLYRTGAAREEVADAEQAEYDSGIRIDNQVLIGQGLFRSINIEGRWATQRLDGMWFGRAPLLANVPDRWKSIDLFGLQQRELPMVPPEADRFAEPRFPADMPPPWKWARESAAGRIALLTRVGDAEGMREAPGVQLSVLREKAKSHATACALEACTGRAITGIQWRPRSDEVLFTVTDPDEGHAQSIFRWNVSDGAVYPVVRVQGLANGGRDRFSHCGVSATALACVTAEANQPPRLERIDLDSGRREVLFNPNAALAQQVAEMPARLLRWTDAEERLFTGQFFPARSSADSPPPLFVTYYHCSGFLRGGIGDEWPLASLAEQGISALCINNPPGYLFDAVDRYERALSGVKQVIERLAREGAVDPARVGMGGLSFGSEVTLWTASHSNLLAAASITSPAIEPNYYLFNTLRDDAFFEELRKSWGLGTSDETPDRWRTLSPTYHLERFHAPILFQMPEQEYLYSLGISLPLVRRAHADLYVFPNEAHQKFQPRHKLAAYERNLDWFRFWLQGHEDTHPGKAGQYAYWRRMRAERSRADKP